MKRILICLICITLLAGLCVLCTGCSSVYTYADLGEMSSGDSYVGKASALDIDWLQGSVTIILSQDNTISVRESGANDNEALNMRYTVKDGTLYVRYAQNKASVPSKLNKKLVVTVPQSILSSIKVSAVSADVSINGVMARTTSVKSVSGDLQLMSMESTTFYAETTSGNIQAWDILADEVKIASISGNVLFSSTLDVAVSIAPQKLTVQTVSGSVLIDTAAVPKNLDVDTTSGDVKVAFPADTAVLLTSHTTSGNLVNQLVQGGDCFADINTISGDISILNRDEK